MSSIHVLTPIDQARQLKRSSRPRGKQRAKRALEVIPHYATHAGAPTLAQAQAAAAGCLADLLVAWVDAHDGCATFDAFESTASFQEAEGVQHE